MTPLTLSGIAPRMDTSPMDIYKLAAGSSARRGSAAKKVSSDESAPFSMGTQHLALRQPSHQDSPARHSFKYSKRNLYRAVSNFEAEHITSTHSLCRLPLLFHTPVPSPHSLHCQIATPSSPMDTREWLWKNEAQNGTGGKIQYFCKS